MTRTRFLIIAAAAAASTAGSQPPLSQAPIAANAKVELKGKVEKVQMIPGQGMPYLQVRTAQGTARVMLGSMRYLMEQDFNPKAGDEVVVKGYRVQDMVVAVTVTLGNKVLRLRDERGRPVWMRGRRGGPMRKASQ